MKTERSEVSQDSAVRRHFCSGRVHSFILTVCVVVAYPYDSHPWLTNIILPDVRMVGQWAEEKTGDDFRKR